MDESEPKHRVLIEFEDGSTAVWAVDSDTLLDQISDAIEALAGQPDTLYC